MNFRLGFVGLHFPVLPIDLPPDPVIISREVSRDLPIPLLGDSNFLHSEFLCETVARESNVFEISVDSKDFVAELRLDLLRE